jgi:hypothetical protein
VRLISGATVTAPTGLSICVALAAPIIAAIATATAAAALFAALAIRCGDYLDAINVLAKENRGTFAKEDGQQVGDA